MSNRLIVFALICAALFVCSAQLVSGQTAVDPQRRNQFCSDALVDKNLIEDSSDLSTVLKAARDAYLKGRSCNQLNAAIFVRKPGQPKFQRGHVNGESLTFPASIYKLPVMVAAIDWCKTKHATKRANCLDSLMRPMMQQSGNAATGSIVDTITGTTNVQQLTASWAAKRLVVENFFSKRGSLGKMRLLTKTYPANSPNSVDLKWAEKRLWETKGRNVMSPNCAGAIMTEIAAGVLLSEDREYMLGLMKQDPKTGLSWIGAGLDPRAQLFTKIGNAMGNLNEVSYIVLPDKTEIVLALFSNCLTNAASPKRNGFDSFARDLIKRISQ